MKKIYLFMCILLGCILHAQVVQCRPKTCMVNYFYHNDAVANANMTAVINFKPDILIDNTAHGYWGQNNGFTGCIPSYYTPYGIEVYSYIAGGYEGTLYNSNIDNLTVNLTRIEGIASDGATGVFLDEVSNFPNDTKKAYLQAIYDKCESLGLKLIFNPGTSSFDSWLMSRCNYLMSDEQYNGTREPSSSEMAYADRMLVIRHSINSADDAATITWGAFANGFGFSYVCTEYTNLPTWLNDYNALISNPSTINPVITTQGDGSLISNFSTGNQWYNSEGPIAGAQGQLFEPNTTGSYYVIVSYGDECATGNSNILNVEVAATESVTAGKFYFYPNPVTEQLTFSNVPYGVTIEIFDVSGKRLISSTVVEHQSLDVQELAQGIYILKVTANSYTNTGQLIKK